MSKKVSQLFIFIFLLLFTTSHCAGKFILVKNTYDFNNSIKVSENKKLNNFVKSSFFYLLGWWVYPFALTGDFFIVNVIEFWTSENPIDSEKTKQTKIYENGSSKIQFLTSENEQTLTLKFQNGNETGEFVFLKNEIGKVYMNKNNQLEEIKLTEKNIGDLKLIQLSENKKIIASRVVSIQEISETQSAKF